VLPRGIEVSTPLLVDYFHELPQRRDKEDARAWRARLEAATDTFRRLVGQRYTEGTLVRLLDHPRPDARRAALTALGLVGTMAANPAVAGRLRDRDPDVRDLATDTLWSLWFRADTESNNRELQRLIRLPDRDVAADGLDRLIRRAPRFAEA